MERNTTQRRAVREVFERLGRPLGPGEVLEAAKKDVPGIGMATIYRTINSLVEEGWLHTVDLPGEPARYELAGLTHHHHFRCSHCNRVFDIEGCTGAVQQLVPRGFRVEGHEILLIGHCADCAKKRPVKRKAGKEAAHGHVH